jgi:hypothetical protein
MIWSKINSNVFHENSIACRLLIVFSITPESLGSQLVSPVKTVGEERRGPILELKRTKTGDFCLETRDLGMVSEHGREFGDQ